LKSSVFNLRFNDGSEGADVTSAGKVFHIFATAKGKARSPIVLGFDRGAARTAVFDSSVKQLVALVNFIF